MVAKADTDAARGQEDPEYLAREKFNAVFDELKKAFPESLPVFVACHRASKRPWPPGKV